MEALIYQVNEPETISVPTEANGQSISLAVPTLSTTQIEYDPAITIEPPLP